METRGTAWLRKRYVTEADSEIALPLMSTVIAYPNVSAQARARSCRVQTIRCRVLRQVGSHRGSPGPFTAFTQRLVCYEYNVLAHKNAFIALSASLVGAKLVAVTTKKVLAPARTTRAQQVKALEQEATSERKKTRSGPYRKRARARVCVCVF